MTIHALERMLGRAFSAPARREPDPYYRAFRARMRSNGHHYKIARDGFIDVCAADGERLFGFAHYGDWHETFAAYLEAMGV